MQQTKNDTEKNNANWLIVICILGVIGYMLISCGIWTLLP